MKRTALITLTICALLLTALTVRMYADEANGPRGSGTEYDPYIITTAEEFYAIRTLYWGDWAGCYIRLGNDIALNDETFTFQPDTGLVLVSDGENIAYLGTGTKGDASGTNTTFDTEASEAGAWYSSDTSTEKGEYTGEIRRWSGLHIDDYASICFDGNGYTLSGLFIHTEDRAGLLSTVYSGFSASNLTIENAYVYGGELAGIVAGYADYGSVANCQFDAIVCSNGNAGGIVGFGATGLSVRACEMRGYVFGQTNAGGIAATGTACVYYTKNFATVQSDGTAAGIAVSASEINACMHLGSVNGKESASGLAQDAAAILYCIQNGKVESDGTAHTLTQNTPFVAKGCYYNASLAPNADPSGTALTNVELYQKESYPDFDFAYTWYMPANSLPDYVFKRQSDLSSALWDGSIAIGFARGDGSEENPYIIENAAQLAYLAKAVNEGNNFDDKFIRLDADITLNDTTKNYWITGAIQWTPIGGTPLQNNLFDIADFRGVFDGNHHTISGLYIDNAEKDYVGLFGLNCFSTVKNLNLCKVFLRGDYGVGGIAGDNNLGTYENCHVDGILIGRNAVGGISGSGGDHYNCRFDGTVSGQSCVGGITGSGNASHCQTTATTTVTGAMAIGGITGSSGRLFACQNYAEVLAYVRYAAGIAPYGGSINQCENYGSVTAQNYVGGICATLTNRVYSSHNYATITGTQYVGGIVGCLYYGSVTSSQNHESVTGQYYVGGISGYIEYDGIDGSSLAYNRNDGAVTGVGYVGGVVGYTEQTIRYCYNTASVQGTMIVGGIAGNATASASILDCFNIGTVRGDISVHAAIGQSHTQSHSYLYVKNNTFLTNGDLAHSNESYSAYSTEDFQSGKAFQDFGLGENFFLKNGMTHPVLAWEITISTDYEADVSYAGGDGSKDSPFLIETIDQLRLLQTETLAGNSYKDIHFRLESNLVFLNEDKTFTPIGFFEGTFDGNGHTIFGLFMVGQNNVGLFSHNGGTIQNLTLSDYSVHGIFNVGSIVGQNDGTIDNCRTEFASVYGYQNVGGIAGIGGVITNCNNGAKVDGTGQNIGGIVGYGNICRYSTNVGVGTVYGADNVGGIAGVCEGEILRCHNLAHVQGHQYAGGIVGTNYKTVSHCQNSGNVHANSYAGGICAKSGGTVEYCVNNAKSVSAGDTASGIVCYAWNKANIQYCINLGKVSATNGCAGIITLRNPATIIGCYYVAERVTQSANSIGIAISENEMGNYTTYSEIPSFLRHFGMSNAALREPTILVHQTHTYDQKIIDDCFLVSRGSCSVPSVYFYSCACGDIGSRTFEATTTDDHTMSEEIVDYHYKVCAECGKKEKVSDHVFDKAVVDEKYLSAPGNCITASRYYYSCVCGEASKTRAFQKAYPDPNHTLEDTWHSIESGHFQHCKDCTYTTTPEPHSYDEGQITHEATEEEMGEMLYTCTVCQHTKTELIPMLPATQKPSSTPTTPKPSTSSPHVEIGCGAVIALVLLAVAMTVIEKKKKH